MVEFVVGQEGLDPVGAGDFGQGERGKRTAKPARIVGAGGGCGQPRQRVAHLGDGQMLPAQSFGPEGESKIIAHSRIGIAQAGRKCVEIGKAGLGEEGRGVGLEIAGRGLRHDARRRRVGRVGDGANRQRRHGENHGANHVISPKEKARRIAPPGFCVILVRRG